MGNVTEKGRRRRARQRKKEKAKQQTYGGDKKTAEKLAQRDDKAIRAATRQEDNARADLYNERTGAKDNAAAQSAALGREQDEYRGKNAETIAEGETQRGIQEGRATQYGLGADKSLADYQGGRDGILGNAQKLESNDWMKNYDQGRSAILGGASQLEGYAQNAAAEYTSAADKAFQASQQRNQKNALAIAAGRGGNSIRTALATANAGNQQAALDQQVVRAQEANQLNSMRNDAIAQAADIRSGLSSQDQAAAAQMAANTQAAGQQRVALGGLDQQAAAQLAQRQQAATGVATGLLGQRADLQLANANYQAQAQGQQQAIGNADVAAGYDMAKTDLAATQNSRDAYLGAQQTQNTGQLGANVQTELQRAEAAKADSGLAKGKEWTNVVTGGILG